MQTATPQTTETVPPSPAAATAPPPADHDAARGALRDLVALCAECAAKETEIAQTHAAEVEAANTELARSRSNVDLRFKGVRDEVQSKTAARVEQISQQFQAELAELKQSSLARKQQAADEYERATADVNHKVQQAVWLAESMFEAQQNALIADEGKAKEKLSDELFDLDETVRLADALIEKYRQAPPVYAGPDEEPLPEGQAPDAVYATTKQEVQMRQAQLKSLTLARLFSGIKPFVIALLITILTAVVATWVAAGTPTTNEAIAAIAPDPAVIGLSILGALVFCGLLGGLLFFVAKSQVRGVYIPMRRAVSVARTAARAAADHAENQRDAAREHAVRKRDREVQVVKSQFAPQLTRATKNRDSALKIIEADYAKRLERIESQRDRALAEATAWQTQHADTIEQKHGAEMQAAQQKNADQLQASKQKLEDETATLKRRWHDGLTAIRTPLAQQKAGGATTITRWDDPAWATWTPPKTFNPRIRFGELRVDLKTITENYPKTLQLPGTFAVPAMLTLPRHASMMIHFERGGRPAATATLQTTMVRLLTNLPAGRVRFTLIDPVGLGQNFAGFMHLADHDDALVGGRIWTEAEHIDQRLADLTEHMETVIQKYLRNEFETIDDYNAQAGELAEPYRFLVIADLPTNFSQESIRRLASIASTGARCGVYVLITRDLRQAIPGGSAHLDEIESNCINIVQRPPTAEVGATPASPSGANANTGDAGVAPTFIWQDEVFRQFPLTLDTPPSEDFLTKTMDVVGRHAKEAKRVEVSFTTIAPPQEKYWTASTSGELSVPVGRAGATRLQSLKLGRGVAQHALIAGKTGSGKSTLLHALVTNTAMWYSPDEVEFYLVDFKKGVEFKTYATNDLPHARAIAVESDREFGLSVLQRIDAELARRGELFRKAGVQDLASYRQATNEKMPRTLLIIDEFQEFFSEDDKLAQDSAVLIDRLVRQGRAFGIHVLLGSQTIGGTSGLSRSTIGQMAIRIALQTSEADSQLILGDNNSAARLLARPGEAIYNDGGGLVENNSPFQVAWLPDEQRDAYLKAVREKVKSNGGLGGVTKREPAIVFEGNAPADITKNRRLLAVLQSKEPPSHQPPRAWFGDPVAIKDPTAVTFRRQAGANVLMVGQQEEAAMALMASAITSLAAQNPATKFYVLDGAPADSPLARVMPRVRDALPAEVKLIEYRATEEAVAELHAEFNHRQSAGGANPPPIYLVVYGLQRYRALRKSEDASFSFGSSDEEKKPQPDKQFTDILRDGPPVGIHTLVWCDTAAALERTLERSAMREFDNRILFQMSAADSSNLIDSPLGNKLGTNRALLYSEEQGTSEKFRPYALPSDRWLAYVKQQLPARG